MAMSLHVLPPHALLLREDATIHFLSPTTLLPQRQPAAFDALSGVYPRPRDGSEFACVQTRGMVAERIIVANKIEREDVPCCWATDGRNMLFGLDAGMLALADMSEHIIYTFSSPDRTDVCALAPSPHAADVFAISCTSGRTYLCRLTLPDAYKDEVLVPEMLHTLPGLAGRQVAALAFHPTSTEPESLMLGILHVREESENKSTVLISDTGAEEETQIWCINVGKSVNLIRRLHPDFPTTKRRTYTTKTGLLRWSKNGRATQFVDNCLVVYDVRRNNGAQELIQTPSKIIAMDILRETGVAWVLNSTMELRVYDLLHCNELLARRVGQQAPQTPKLSYAASPPRMRKISTEDATPNRRSSDILAYYLSRSPGPADEENAPRVAAVENVPEVDEDDISDEEYAAYPTTAIRVNSPIWTFTEPRVRQDQEIPATAIPVEGETAMPEPVLPEPILPDCLFMNLGDLMQGSDTGLELLPPSPSTSRTLLEVLFGWPPAYAGTSVRDLIAWERQRALAVNPATATFVRMILNIWLRDAESSNPANDLEVALASVQSLASTRAMTVSISWLVYAMHLVTLKQSSEGMAQQMARVFTNSVLFQDSDCFGDDVEAVHLAVGMLVGCGLIREAREVYRANSYFMEATILSLLFGFPVEEILREWVVQASDSGAERILLRCRNALALLATTSAQKSAPLMPAPRLYPPTPTQSAAPRIQSTPPASTTSSPASNANAIKASPAPSTSSSRWRRPDLSIQLFNDETKAPAKKKSLRGFPTRSDSLRKQTRLEVSALARAEDSRPGANVTRERTIISTDAPVLKPISGNVRSLESVDDPGSQAAIEVNVDNIDGTGNLGHGPTVLKSGTPRGGVMKFLMAGHDNGNPAPQPTQQPETGGDTKPHQASRNGQGQSGERRNKGLLRSLTSGSNFAPEENGERSGGSGGNIWKRFNNSDGGRRLFRSASERVRGQQQGARRRSTVVFPAS